MNRQETIEYLKLDTKTPKKETSTSSTFDLTQQEYAKIFTLLDRNESDWNEDSETIDNSDDSIMESKYYSKSGELTLIADLDKDEYSITIEDKDNSKND